MKSEIQQKRRCFYNVVQKRRCRKRGDQVDSTVIVSLISLLGTLAGTFGGIVVSGKLTAYRIEQLERRVNEHNNFARRMPVVEEQIKEINHRIEDLESEVRNEN